MEKVIIAVDAGGTKTKICAINKDKKIVYQIIGGIGSPAVVSENEALKTIETLLDQTINNLNGKYDIMFMQLGISGLGVMKDIKSFEEKLFLKYNIEVSIENDVVIALYSIITNQANEGILVLSGTGSAILGINKEETFMVGGFGHLLTEYGSSYISVKMLITSIIEFYEENKAYTELGKSFMELISIKQISDFRAFMYQKTKSEVAEYSKFISNQAKLGNLQAMEILKKCGQDLAHGVLLLYKHLHLSSKAVVGFRGSFIVNAYGVKEELMKCLTDRGYNPEIVSGEDDPIYGAYYLALRKNKIC